MAQLPQFSETIKPTDEELRERFYKALSNTAREIFADKRKYSKETGRLLLEQVVELIFAQAIQSGYFRFPNGYGSLKVQRLKRNPQMKRLPDGRMVPMPHTRTKLRYEEGAAVREGLGMPPQTNYKRRFNRQSKLTKKTKDLLNGSIKKGADPDDESV